MTAPESLRRLSQRQLAEAIFAGFAFCALFASTKHGVHIAYIGPGSGFAFLGSFLSVIAGFFGTALSIISWPVRMAWRSLHRIKGLRHARVKKVIVLGLDGLDPKLTERYMKEEKLPNLARLASEGSYTRLRTTYPALSPVAWSTFATGVNPAKHNIFDFLDRSLKNYVPQLSSARVTPPNRCVRIFKWKLPLSRPRVEFRRRSKSFWRILGEQGIPCTIQRIPITFPPEKCSGMILSAMATPDLKGTQGSFSQFTTRLTKANFENGDRYPLRADRAGYEGEIAGPEDTFSESNRPLRIPFKVLRSIDGLELRIQKHRCRLKLGQYTEWLQLRFRNALGISVTGIARFLLTEDDEALTLYASPINIDPFAPALPISHPSIYSKYLANLIGPFATAGMAEDTWALNEGVIDNDAFLRQAYDIFREREAMFVSALENSRLGVIACVFDTSDRLQHMFYRYEGTDDPYADVVPQMYQKMDALVGKTLEFVDETTALFVLSDHGFCSFRRGVNLNTWLRDHGYLRLKAGTQGEAPFFEDVDWSGTRAFALGLGGIFLNVAGREGQGIVEPGSEASELKRCIIRGLCALREVSGEKPIRAVYDTASLYRGPYLSAAPDLIVGYQDGYRVSWESAVGRLTPEVLLDNQKAWGADHCVDPQLVPGVLFSNRVVKASDSGIEDLAPTVLSLFGIPAPEWMEGKCLI